MEVDKRGGGGGVAWLGWMLSIQQCCFLENRRPSKLEWEGGWGAQNMACKLWQLLS